MTVSQRQFDQLTSMGITLWQRKSLVTSDLDLTTQLRKSQFFRDVLYFLECSSEQISYHNNHVSLADLTWQFNDDEAVSLQNKVLTTPALNNLQQSVSLKAHLWQVLQRHKL